MPPPVQWKMLCPAQLQKHQMPNNQGNLLICKGPKCEFTCKGSVPRMEFNQNCSTPVGGVKNSIITINNGGIDQNIVNPPCPGPEIEIINDALATPIGGVVDKGFLVAGLPPWTVADGFVVLNIGQALLDFIGTPIFASEITITGTSGAVTFASVVQPPGPIVPGGFYGAPVSLNGTALGPFTVSFEVHTNDVDEGVFPFSWTGTIV